ncbi:MAG: GNAT family N-acetyltransferase [Bacteriovoracaceae bacterium]|nr:GNAT family N-acetyltransferase [Bacteriovoracaceae bacterium]
MEKLVTAKNGEQFIIRPIRSEDREEIRKSLLKLSSNSIGQRFFAMKSGFSEEELNFFTNVDDYQHIAYVAIHLNTDTDELEGAGVIRAVRSKKNPQQAEIAVTIIDKFQGIGLGKILLSFLSDRAGEKAITAFTGTLYRTNSPMIRLLTKFKKLTTFAKESQILSFEAELPFKA